LDIHPAPSKTKVANEQDFRILLLTRSQSITGIKWSTTDHFIARRLIGTARGNRLVSGSQSKTTLPASRQRSICCRHEMVTTIINSWLLNPN